MVAIGKMFVTKFRSFLPVEVKDSFGAGGFAHLREHVLNLFLPLRRTMLHIGWMMRQAEHHHRYIARLRHRDHPQQRGQVGFGVIGPQVVRAMDFSDHATIRFF